MRNGSVILYISIEAGSLLTLCSTSPGSAFPVEFKPGDNVVDCVFPMLMLSAGTFTIGAGLAIPNIEWLDNQPDAARLTIEARDIFRSGLAPSASSYPVPMAHVWRFPDTRELMRFEDQDIAVPERSDLL
jgi:hypothetical protein